MDLEYSRCDKLPKSNIGSVSTLYRSSTEKASYLCLYDIVDKLKTSNYYDIGGTYTGDQPDFWFYYTTSMCHGFNFLLNLFVLSRKPRNFSLFIPNSYQLSDQTITSDVKQAIIYGSLEQLTFKTTQKDEHLFVKTFQFDAEDLITLENGMLYLPLKIQIHTRLQLDPNVVRTIKLQHDLGGLLTQKESTDYILESNSGTKYSVHKVLLAAHSPVLRSYLDNPEQNLSLDVSDNTMNILLEFLYTGTLKDLYQLDYMVLLDIAEKLEFKQLFALAQQILGTEITINNAINIAVLAKKYKLDKLTYKVFNFIKECPDALTTDSWHNLEDIELVKQLIKYIHPPSKNIE